MSDPWKTSRLSAFFSSWTLLAVLPGSWIHNADARAPRDPAAPDSGGTSGELPADPETPADTGLTSESAHSWPPNLDTCHGKLYTSSVRTRMRNREPKRPFLLVDPGPVAPPPWIRRRFGCVAVETFIAPDACVAEQRSRARVPVQTHAQLARFVSPGKTRVCLTLLSPYISPREMSGGLDAIRASLRQVHRGQLTPM